MPQFKKGQSGNPFGRPRGARNQSNAKVAIDVFTICQQANFCPFVKLVEVAQDAKDRYLQFNAAKELAQYMVPKLRSVTVAGDAANPVSFALYTGVATKPTQDVTLNNPGGANDPD